jgi:hypothetical protein
LLCENYSAIQDQPDPDDANASQYEMPFKLSISTFHVSVMASTPAIASHKVRHPSPSNFSMFMIPRQKGWLP